MERVARQIGCERLRQLEMPERLALSVRRFAEQRQRGPNFR